MRTRLPALVCAAMAVLAAPATVLAQATATAVVEGTVMDQTKAVIPGSTVTIANKTTGLRRSMADRKSVV